MNNEPSVYLIHQEMSHGDAILDTLQLLFRNGNPILFGGISWRGGFSHADGVSNYVENTSEMLPSLTAESLTDWKLRTLIESNISLADFPAFLKDEQGIVWCDTVRRMFHSSSAAE